MHFPLMGLAFRPKDAKDIVANFEKGQVLFLERDSGNQYDPDAVKVVYYPDEDTEDTGVHVGFVPREQNHDLATWFDDREVDEPVTVIVTGIADPKKPTLYLDDSIMEEDEGEDE